MNQNLFINTTSLLAHWQGHRALSRKIFLAFPDESLHSFSVGGMRPYSQLFLEMIKMSAPSIKGFATGEWENLNFNETYSKDELLWMWDQATLDINHWWNQIKPEKFQEVDKAFGQWEGKVYDLILYLIDNEIHHRGQGYVYLRALGIEPPFFWDRG